MSQLDLVRVRARAKEQEVKVAQSKRRYIPQEPTERQRLFLSLPHQEAFYGGAVGGGKSSALLMGALQYVDAPRYSALILRRTYQDLSKPGALLDRAREWLAGSGARWNEQKKQWRFPSGAVLSFGYLENEADIYQYQCFHPDTEMLTLDGWKLVSQVKRGELAATMDPATREMIYEPVTETWAYPYEGELITLRQRNGAAFAVTLNHTIWASTNRRPDELKPYRADGLPVTAKIPQWANWQGREPEEEYVFASDGHNGRTVRFSADEWCSFLGWYIAEGNTWVPRWAIVITQVNEKGRAIIQALLDRVGVNYHLSDKGFSFNNKALCRYLAQFGLSGEKHLPADAKCFDRDSLRILLYALVEGDGTWYSPDHGRFVSSSRRLIDDVCEIAIKAGFRPTVGQAADNPPDSPYGNKPRWYVSLRTTGGDTNICSNSHDGRILPRREHYKGSVYCVTVPPHHTVLIRYQGRVSWSGQSSEYQAIFFDELTQFTERQYTYLFSRLRRLTDSNVPLRMRSASNPGGIGADWVYARFIPEDWQPEDAAGLQVHERGGRAFVPARLEDNPYLDAETYEQSLAELDDVTRAQLRRGDWRIRAQGNIYKAWTDGPDSHHVITWSQFAAVFNQRRIPSHWLGACGQDWGFDPDPCATVWNFVAAENSPAIACVPLAGSVFAPAVLTCKGEIPDHVGDKIRLIESEHEWADRIEYRVMSHEASSQRETYRVKCGLSFQKWKPDAHGGIAQVQHALKLRHLDKPHPFKPWLTGRPNYYVIVPDDQAVNPKGDEGLALLRAEFREYRYTELAVTERKGSSPIVPYDFFNHYMDAQRGIAARWFAPTQELTADERFEESLSAGYRRATVIKLEGDERDLAEMAREREVDRRKREDGAQTWSNTIVDASDNPWNLID